MADASSSVKKREWYYANRDRILERKRKWRADNPGATAAHERKSRLLYPARHLLKGAKARAKRDGLPFALILTEDNTSPFDLIVDDASHLERHQIHSVNSFIPFVQPDGFYIIEDVNDPKALSPYLPAPHFSVFCIAPDSRLVGQCIVIPR